MSLLLLQMTDDSQESGNLLAEIWAENKLVVVVAGVGVVMVLLGLGEWRRAVTKTEVEFIESEDEVQEVEGGVVVDVSGQVERPGVYRLSSGSRIGEALEAAGGLTQDADQEYITKNINLAEKLIDGGKIYIPAANETGKVEEVVGSKVLGTTTQLVKLNSASIDELESLIGVGQVRAKAIIDNRPYQSLEELVTKAKIPQKIIDDNRDKLSL